MVPSLYYGALAAGVMRRRNAGATGADTDAGAPVCHTEEGDVELGVVQDNLSDAIAESVDAPACWNGRKCVCSHRRRQPHPNEVRQAWKPALHPVRLHEHRPASMAFSSDMQVFLLKDTSGHAHPKNI